MPGWTDSFAFLQTPMNLPTLKKPIQIVCLPNSSKIPAS